MITLKKNERLVYAGNTALRAPDGTPLSAVPQYMIVPVDEAEPANIVELGDNERLVYGGRVFNNKRAAEERFAALKAGQTQSRRDIGTPLYFIEDAANIDPKTGRTYESEKIIATMAKEFTEVFAVQKRREQALAKQGKL